MLQIDVYKNKLWENTEEMIRLRDRCTEAEKRNESLLSVIGRLENRLASNTTISSDSCSLRRSVSQPTPGSRRSSYASDNNPFGSSGIGSFSFVYFTRYV